MVHPESRCRATRGFAAFAGLIEFSGQVGPDYLAAGGGIQ
jgi:hypothetical protein